MALNQTYELNNVITELLELIDKINEKVEKIWKMFTMANFDFGMNCLADFFQDIDYLISNIENVEFKRKSKISTQEMLGYFNMLENYMIICDYVMISDLIRYEIKPIINNWKVDLVKEIKYRLN